MCAKIKKNYTPGFKFKVAMAAVSGEQTLDELSQKYKVHATQISNWKKYLLDNGSDVFNLNPTHVTDKNLTEEIDSLYEKIGRLSTERDFLKKTLDF